MKDEITYSKIFKSLFINSFEGILISDFQNIIIEVNPAFEKISGYTKDEFIDKNLIEFLPEDFHNKLIKRREKLKIEGRVDLGDFNFFDKSGALKIVEVSSSTIPYNNETVVLTILRDVTEKRKIETLLHKEKEFSENLIKSLPGIFYLIEIVNDEPLLIRWNDNFNKESFLTDKELYKKNILSFFSEEEQQITKDYIERLKAGNFEVESTTTNPKLKDGSIQRYFYQAVGFKLEGKLYYLGTGTNISEQRDLERKLIESVIQTEESERRRIASDLHDGLGPELSAIKLYVQGLLDNKDESIKIELGNKVLKLVDRAVDTISEISFNISPHILLNYGIEAAINLFINKLQIHPDLKITTHFDKIERFGVNEELTLYRTITELFNNSLKYAFASEIILDITIKKNHIYVLYTDNGKGFDLNEVMRKKTGMGIQNMISRIESLEGTFKLHSKINEGMLASIFMPYAIKKNEKN